MGSRSAGRQAAERSHRRPPKKGLTSGPRSPIPGPLRVLDPACGAGSFLLGAYEYLLCWHLDYYTTNAPEEWARGKNPPICQAPRTPTHGPRPTAPTYRLSITERKRILLDHIYGVDIDGQAVEVTKLSLLLKVLEGESQQTPDNQPHLFHERALPDLSSNIKCGNSLIGPDFYDGQQMGMFDEEERYRINAFDWQAEFPEVFGVRGSGSRTKRANPGPQSPTPDPRSPAPDHRSGFDVVIGNPPYLSFSGRQATEPSKAERVYFGRHYQSAGWPTSHGLFVERALKDLSRRFAAFIVPDQMGHLGGYQSVRQAITQRAGLTEVRYWGESVFKGVVTPALTFVADKTYRGRTLIQLPDGERHSVKCEGGGEWTPSEARHLIAKLRNNSHSLGNLVADPGVHTGNCSKKLILPAGEAKPGCMPILEGKQVSRYRCDRPAKVLKLDYPAKRGEYFTIRPKHRYTDAPFVIRQTAPCPLVGPREHADYFRNSLLALYRPRDGTDVRYLVGLLNSRLIRYVYRQTVRESRQKAFPQVKVRSLRELPIREIDLDVPEDKRRHDRMVQLVQQMFDLHKQLSAAKTPTGKTVLQRQIDATNKQIDRQVYELYELSDDETRIVEKAADV
ncbi:MAG: TaqI-like C-terminal specificity domain-containing protein [Planctomycetota bacterium]